MYEENKIENTHTNNNNPKEKIMDILQAKQIVVEAGNKLVSTGLIARTWGNVSCRVSATQFVITPSGKAYDAITTDDIVLMNIADCSYEGDVKPSGEKGIHAECYRLRPEVNFVIHTHQVNASLISAIGYDINGITGESCDIIGDNITISSYGLPGSGKLKQGVVDALTRSNSKAVILKHHGAVCLGSDYEDAFNVANEVETVCAKFIFEKYAQKAGKVAESFEELSEYVVNLKRRAQETPAQLTAYDSERFRDVVILCDKEGKNVATIELKKDQLICGDTHPIEADLHTAVYKKRSDVKAIVHSKNENIVAASKYAKTIKPLLDDFAQITGVTVRSATFDVNNTLKSAKKVAKALGGKSRNAVLIKDNGALCCGTSQDEAKATEMVMDKGCQASIVADLFERKDKVSVIDSYLMNIVYRLKYSKKK